MTSQLLDTARIWARVPANSILWFLRRRFGHLLSSDRPPRPRTELKVGLLDDVPARERAIARDREQELRTNYELTTLRACATRSVYRENLVLLDMLERTGIGRPTRDASAPLRALDVGSRNWTYVHGLRTWLEHRYATAAGEARPMEFVGVEIDGYWVNRDGRPRCDHARAHAAEAMRGTDHEARYEITDFTRWPTPVADGDLFDVVTMFFPFVTVHALVAWGLPPWLHAPRALFERAAAVLRPESGRLVTWHQTDEEAWIARRLALDLGLELLSDEPWESVFVRGRHRGSRRRQLVFRRSCGEAVELPRARPHAETNPNTPAPRSGPRRSLVRPKLQST